MHKFSVLLAIARGACFDIGQRIKMIVFAEGPLAAAITAEKLADLALGENEYSRAKRVKFIPWGEPASLAMAA